MQAQPQKTRSFIKCVLSKHHKHKAPLIKNWIVQKRKHNQAVKYKIFFYYCDIMFNITPWNEPKFPEIVQRIYNAIFISVCQICLTKTKKTGKKPTWYNDLNHKHKEELSTVVHKIQVVPLSPKRGKLSETNNFKSSWQYVQHKVNNQREQTKVNDQRSEIVEE